MKNALQSARALLLASVSVTALWSGAAQAGSYQHVIILSVDGLHQADLTDPNTNQFLPNILALEKTGVSYTNARTTSPSDSFPSTLALVTGATTKSTGVFYDDSYARNLYAPGTTLAQIQAGTVQPGTEVMMAENLDKNQNLLNGGGDYGKGALDTTQLPVDKNGNVVYPWNYNHTNTIFDIAKAAGLTSYVSDKHPAAYNILQGQTGSAITALYSPEVNSQTAVVNIGGVMTLVDPSTAPAGTQTGNALGQLGLTTNNYQKTEAYDNLKLAGLTQALMGINPATNTAIPGGAPNILYSNFQAVSVAQKLGSNSTGVGGIDIVGGKEVVNPALASALMNINTIVGTLVQTLKNDNLYDSTQIILTAKHGQAPRIGAATLIADSTLPGFLAAKGITIAQATQDNVALLWLSDQSQFAALNAALVEYMATHPEVQQVWPGSTFGSPGTDNRTPDVIVQLKDGYIYVGNTTNTRKRAEHGNVFQDDSTWVPLILSGGLPSDLQGTSFSNTVYTTQVAPTVLADLGLDPNGLNGVQLEGTQQLPVPEPVSLSLLLAGLGGLGVARRKRG